MANQQRGPMYGLSWTAIQEAAEELTGDVRTAVAGIDAAHGAEDDVSADACGAMRKTLARACRATPYHWEVETLDHRARHPVEGRPITVVGEAHTGADIGFILYDSASARVKVLLVQAKRRDQLQTDKRAWKSLATSCSTIEAGIAAPGGWAWIYQFPPTYETTAFSAAVVRAHDGRRDPVASLLTGDDGHTLTAWFESVLTCHYGSLTTHGHVQTWIERHRPRHILTIAPPDRAPEVQRLLGTTLEVGYREVVDDESRRPEPG